MPWRVVLSEVNLEIPLIARALLAALTIRSALLYELPARSLFACKARAVCAAISLADFFRILRVQQWFLRFNNSFSRLPCRGGSRSRSWYIRCRCARTQSALSSLRRKRLPALPLLPRPARRGGSSRNLPKTE